MEKLDFLKRELDDMIEKDISYEELLKKSREIDHYVTKEMIKINRKIINVVKI